MTEECLKAICLSGIAQSDINEVQSALLAFFVETYLPLNEAEEEEFQKLIQREEVTVMQFITSWERQGIIKGRAEEALTASRKHYQAFCKKNLAKFHQPLSSKSK